MRVQGEIKRDLEFHQLTRDDEARLTSAGIIPTPEAREKAGADRATQRMSWVFSAFVAGYLLLEVPMGWLGDRFGSRRVLFRIVLWWSLFTAATGSIQGIASLIFSNAGPTHWLWTMILVRFLFGVGEAGAYPNMARVLGRWFPFGERAFAQSFIWFASRLGGALAPVTIGGLLALGGTWSRAFHVLGIIGVLWAIAFFWWFRDRPEEVSGVNEVERDWIRGSEPVRGTIYDDDAGPQRLKWSSLISPNVLALCLVSFSVSFCFYFFITFLPQYLKDQFKVDYQQSQLVSGLPLLAGGLACLVGGFLSDRAVRWTSSRRWGRSVIPICAWAAAGLCVLAVPSMHSPTGVMILLALGFAFQDLGVPVMWSMPADIGGRFAGTLGGWMNTAGSLGGLLSPLLAAKISISYGWNAALFTFGAVYFLGATAWFFVDGTRPMQPAD
jgi:MFS family permease